MNFNRILEHFSRISSKIYSLYKWKGDRLFIMLMGLPGSGKTEYSEHLVAQHWNTIVVSIGAMRTKLCLSEKDLFLKAEQEIVKNLRDGKIVIYDGTNSRRATRKRILKFIDRNVDVKKLAIMIDAAPEKCIENLKLQNSIVGDEIVYKVANNFQYPKLDEGWQIIKYIDEDFKVLEIIE